ncbi:MAG: hypothetical protein GX493_11310 [Firmicutes bacterium]|nr:hypothetical protein [Bacillota bacterium]
MAWLGFLFGNLGILLFMLLFSFIWDIVATRRERRMGEPVHAYRPSRAEWWRYYSRRVRSYLVSYALVLGLLVFLPLLFGQKEAFRLQLINLVRLLPGLAGYFVLAGVSPARFLFYRDGFSCHAFIPFLPGRRMERGQGTPSAFRVGTGFWAAYRPAVPRGEVLLIQNETMAVEFFIPRGERDRLLGLAREGLKRAKEERRRERRAEKDSIPLAAGTKTEGMGE